MKLSTPSSSNSVIAVTDLTCRFGSKTALEGLSLFVPKGAVFGLMGENGSGKTTLIKHLLGLLAPQSGAVRLFGQDPVSNTVSILARLGYLSERRELPGWMRVEELMNFTAAFYPSWDENYARHLLSEFQLDQTAKVRTLSLGQQAKMGLLLALAYKPELLILDEPSTGLDPVARRDILEAIVRTIGEEGRTVLFSSHLLDEIERVSDHLAMIHDGKIVFHGPLDEVKSNHRKLVLRFDEPQMAAPHFAGFHSATGSGREWQVLCTHSKNSCSELVSRFGVEIINESIPSLDEIFVARVKGLKTR